MRAVSSRVGSDVVVVGGGVIGLAAAWRTATSGRRVTVVDPRPGGGATWAAAGMLAPVGEAHYGEERLSALLVRGARAWPGFAADLEEAADMEIGYRAEGTLLVAVDPSDRAAVDELLEYRRSLGLTATTLSSADCRSAEPLLAPGVRGGADLVDDHQVDNRRLVAALLEATRREGVVMVAGRATAVDGDDVRVRGVTLEGGDQLWAESVVVAAGCWSGQLDGWPRFARPPVRPVRGLTLRLRSGRQTGTLRRPVRGLVHGRTCYLVPRADGSLVVGATVEERGFDLTVEAGSVGDLLDDARRLVPSVEAYELCETSTGLRPGTPDNAPLVGTAGVDGLVVATGHYRNGILLAPSTAEEVVRLLDGQGRTGADRTSPFAHFRPDRFGNQGAGPPDTALLTTARRRAASP